MDRELGIMALLNWLYYREWDKLLWSNNQDTNLHPQALVLCLSSVYRCRKRASNKLIIVMYDNYDN